ncbi:DUF2637 domain-containing protein [Streptomyces sp. NPDC054865]
MLIALIGFIGSYSAVQELASEQGFGAFSHLFPIGIDAGILVLLAMDLLLSWIRIPLPLLRQTAWLLTAATIAFNGAAAWPDPLAVGMHAVIPVLFVVTVEAARHAVGRIADITADRHIEGVRLMRWLLSPIPTFKLWRRMKLWELRSYQQAVGMEQDRLVYQARLEAQFGRAWRRRAPIEALMPLRLAKYGVPLDQARRHPDTQPALPPATAADPDQPADTDQAIHAGTPSETRPATVAVTPGNDTAMDNRQPTADPVIGAAPDQSTPPSPPPVDGRTAVQKAYDLLPAADQTDMSARKLAQRLAPEVGLTENTVRVYVTALRRERRLLVVVPESNDSAVEPPPLHTAAETG